MTDHGDRGPAGERGPMGDKGFPGFRGEQGDDGRRGPKGAQGNVILPRSMVYKVAALVLVCSLAAMLFMTVVVGTKISDNRAQAVCEATNDLSAYLRYDARFNDRLPQQRAKLADDFLVLHNCSAQHRPPLTALESNLYVQQHLAPIAKRAGLSPDLFAPAFRP